jgi:hypothetical protein
MYYSMPINMFFIVKNHWEPSFTDNPRRKAGELNCGAISVQEREENM